MPSLKDFCVSEDKVWFGKYWPKGVPKHLYQVEGIKIESMFNTFISQATEEDFWDKVVCLAVFGPYIEKVIFRTLYNYARKFGSFLSNLGIRKGDVIAIDLPNSINFVIAYMGAQYIGAIVVGINPTYKPMELLHSLDISEAKVFVMMDALYIAGPNTILSKTKVKHVISTNLLDFITAPPDKFQSLRNKIPNFQDKIPDKTDDYIVYRMKNIIENTEIIDIKPEIDPWEDPAVLLMTGGTTGLPKLAMLSHANLISDLYQLKPWVNLKTGMITIGSLPFFHSFGMTTVMNGALCLGMKMLLFPRPPEDELLCETINKLDTPEGIIYIGVEMLFKRLINFVEHLGKKKFKKKYDFHKKLKYVVQGASPLHDYVRIPFEDIFCPIRAGYGLTETSPVISLTPFWGHIKIGKIGLPLPSTDWAIFKPDDFESGPICDGTKERGNFGIENTGEICVAGPQIMLGYKGEIEKEENIRFWNGQRWLQTGDIGFMDEYGWCEIRDRKKSLIKVSGHSVYPKEVEELMGKHEAIDEVAIAGIPNELRGEVVKAWVTLKKGYKEGKNITSQQIKEWCLKNIAKWKIPEYIEFVRKMPISFTGKVQHRVLQTKDIERLKKGREIKG